MNKYYYCIENQKIYSIEQLKKDYISFVSEGATEPEPFEKYIFHSLWFNNGSLVPIHERINQLNRTKSKYTDSESIEAIENEISILKQYL